VATAAPLISAGTERSVIDLARKNLLSKARQRPDQVRRVLQKVRQEGALVTARQVFAKLKEPMPLGYSSAGVVLECGAGVQDFKPGDRIATAGPHAGIVAVGSRLCAQVPAGVSLEDAAYGAVGAIALQGVRLARVGLGDRVLVIGLGLVGQLAACLARAQGAKVYGIDPNEERCRLAEALGVERARTHAARDDIAEFCCGVGVDAVLLTAATASNEPVELAADVCRPKGRIVVVGVVGLTLPRAPFFQKELEFTVSSSLGPGRGDPLYEERGQDYPVGYARWTAQRNMSAVLESIATGALPVRKLTTHRYAIDEAAQAYALIASGRAPFLGIILGFGETPARPQRRVELTRPAARADVLGVSIIGTGNFVRLGLMPILARQERIGWRGIVSARGLSARELGEAHGFSYVATDAQEALADTHTDCVFITTRHDSHATLVIAALRAGKHVFVEKPLCITEEELVSISACVDELGAACPVLMVGFNRRFAPATAGLQRHFEGVGPLAITYRFAAGAVPASAWHQDPHVGGGRIVGEACHAIDLCTALAGAPPVRVFAESTALGGVMETTDDRVFIILRHENGAASSIAYQAGGDRAGPTERVEVFGGGRTATLEGWDRLFTWRNGKRRRLAGGRDKGHSVEVERFLAACREGRPSPIPWLHLQRTTWASLAAVSSLRTGEPVVWPGGAASTAG
jgi:predicted dehydrogenase